MKHVWMICAALAAVVVALVVVGCGGGSSEDTASLQVLLSDAPFDARAVDVTISRIDVSTDGAGWTTLKSFDPELTLNLLDYRYDGKESTPASFLLSDTPLEPDHYTQIRLILTKIEIEDNLGNRYECEMNSQDKTGLKIVGGFDVAPGTKSAVLIDFDAARSIVEEGNGTYRLHPTVRVVPVQITGAIKGIVTFKDAEGTVIPVPAAASIVASQGGVFVASSPVIEDGSFLISALLAGAYDIALEFPEGTTPTYALSGAVTGSVTAQTETDLGTLEALPVQ